MSSESVLLVTFTYSHITGVFTGHLPNGVTFRFLNHPDLLIPSRLGDSLRALQTNISAEHQADTTPLVATPVSDLDQKIANHIKDVGINFIDGRRVFKPTPPKLSLEELKL